MNIKFHPHKGYLNTKFTLLYNGESSENFIFCRENDSSVVKSITVQPHMTESIYFEEPGMYSICKGKDVIQYFNVEDGYKFGGSVFKNAFVFEKTPWVFVVMKDRTYFHNRETGHEYVEAISPDLMEYVSPSYVLLSNKNDNLMTLYSLKEEKPVIVFENLIKKNENVIVWKETGKESTVICIANLKDTNRIRRIECDDYMISNRKQCIYCYSGCIINVVSFFDIWREEKKEVEGQVLTFINEIYFVCRKNSTDFHIVNIEDLSIRTIHIAGTLAKINGKVFVDVNKRVADIKNISTNDVPECTLTGVYTSIEIFPSFKRLTYIEKKEEIHILAGIVKKTVRTVICDENGIHIANIDPFYRIYKYDNLSCLLSKSEFYVVNSSCGNFIEHGRFDKIFQTPCGIYAIKSKDGKSTLVNINWRGYISEVHDFQSFDIKDYSFSYFEYYGVIKHNTTKVIYKIKGNTCYNVGIFIFDTANGLQLKKGIIVKGGDLIITPFSLYSEEGTYGLEIDNNQAKVYLYNIKKSGDYSVKTGYSKVEILADLFDGKSYQNVLLSEDGSKILSRNREKSQIIDILTGNTIEFDNDIKIEHINGIRPYFKFNNNRQLRLINPINGVEVDIDSISQYNFVSPYGTYYADVRLEEYIEYYHLVKNKLIEKEEYDSLMKKCRYKLYDETENKKIELEQKRIIECYYDYLISKLEIEPRTKEEYINTIIKKTKIRGCDWFLNLLIEKRGVAIIRRKKDNNIAHRISLGEPLWFLNYVAFSHDEKYVAIAGRYPNGIGKGGLLLIYNLEENKVVYQHTNSYAVWTTAFSKRGELGAYTSTPNTYFGEEPFANKVKIINSYSFLTFSPDGSLIALSKQGYIAWNNGRNMNWGHQPSCIVSIRRADSPNSEIVEFKDLSDSGIEGSNRPRTVSSVSFSNNNKCVMMVGNDGIVVIRNMHLQCYV